MKKIITTIIFLLIIFIISLMGYGNRTRLYKINNLQNKVYSLQDTIGILSAEVDYYKDLVNICTNKFSYNIDSSEIIIDSLQTEIKIRDFQLERIKYYNEIAAKGNNIKFLRGWIKRVFN